MLCTCFRPLECCFGRLGGGDGLLWHLDLKRHASGDFSIAVVQANSSLEDQAQVLTSPSVTYVSVYDGHDGPEASRFVNNRLFPISTKRKYIMWRGSNSVIGAVNFITFFISTPILSGGIWLSARANNTECLKFLQWPTIIIVVYVMVVSLAGFAGTCYRQTWLLQLYLFAMFFVIAALIGFIVFKFAVTEGPDRMFYHYFEVNNTDYYKKMKIFTKTVFDH